MAETTVTLKYGKGYEETWAVFKGATPFDVRDQILEYFDIESEPVEKLSLHELVVNVTQIAHGGSTASALLGAVAIPQTQHMDPADKRNPWADIPDEFAPQREEANPHAELIAQFAAAQSTTDLQKIWYANQSAFTDETVQAAYKARGKELQ